MIRKNSYLLPIFGICLSLFGCKKDGVKVDTPAITSYQTAEVAYMGDSIPLSITAIGDYPLNNIKVTFSRGDQRISETIILAHESGTFNNKLLVPFVKDIEDGTAEIQIMVKNKNFDYSTASVPIQMTRPKFPYLTLKTAFGDYKMEPVPGEDYKYAVTDAFPATKLNAIIEAPAYGDNGNAFYFGGSTIVANATDQDSIPFQILKPLGSTYTVSFNTRSFIGEPFLKPSFAGIEFPPYENDITVIESPFTQNQPIEIDGILDIDEWWIDPTFLAKGSEGSYTFRAIDGQYRVTADRHLKYFRIEPMAGDGLADFDPATHSGGVYINGGVGSLDGSAPKGRLGIPSFADNPTLWDPTKNIAMAPLGDGIFQVKLVAGTTLFQSNVSGSTVGISFYQNSRTTDNAFPLTLAQTLYGSPGSTSSSAGTPRFELNANNSSMVVSGSNRTLGFGRTYVFTLDTKVSPAALTISLE